MDLFVQMMSMLTAGCFVDSWVPIGVVTESEHAESEEISLPGMGLSMPCDVLPQRNLFRLCQCHMSLSNWTTVFQKTCHTDSVTTPMGKYYPADNWRWKTEIDALEIPQIGAASTIVINWTVVLPYSGQDCPLMTINAPW
jgi:hypothetical protein